MDCNDFDYMQFIFICYYYSVINYQALIYTVLFCLFILLTSVHDSV